MGYINTSMENVDTNDTGTCIAEHDVQSSCSVADASTADDTDANDEGASDDETTRSKSVSRLCVM